MVIKILMLIIALLGVGGTLVPMLPGTPFILVAAIIYGCITDFAIITWRFIIMLLMMSIVAEIIDYASGVLGAKYFGASKFGIVGALVGAVGAFFVLGAVGLLIGPLLGTVVTELIVGKEWKEAIKTGLGTIIGNFSGTLFSFLIAMVMTILLALRIF